MGRVLARCGLAAEAIVTSPLPRARRTAELVAEALGLEGRLENSPELVASRSEIQVTDWLRTRPERTLLIVGHDPWITDLVGKLAGAPGMQVRMAKAGVARLDRNDDQTVWELKWLVSPKLLLRVGE
jgi:phosphohistidine phosphatase